MKKITTEEKCQDYCSNTDACNRIGKTPTMRELCECPKAIQGKAVTDKNRGGMNKIMQGVLNG